MFESSEDPAAQTLLFSVIYRNNKTDMKKLLETGGKKIFKN